MTEGGKPSLTSFSVVENFKDFTLVSAEPVTGRTHQIRVHAQQAGHPLVGDPKYGNDEITERFKQQGLSGRLFLHAYSLTFKVTPEDKAIKVEAPLPEDLQKMLEYLRR